MDPIIQDSIRGWNGNYLRTDTTSSNYGATSGSIQGVSTTGFTVADNNGNYQVNDLNYHYVSWTFRKAPKFFDVVTYT